MEAEHDVAILGWWHNSNYGSIMTYFALNQAISSLGHSTVLVNEALGYKARATLPEDAPAIAFTKRKGFKFTKQEHYENNKDLNNIAKTFIVGSDQLWNPYIPRINDDLFLNFTTPEKKRVAYGTSIGNFNLNNFRSSHFGTDFEEVQKHNLKRFDHISMREDDGVEYFTTKLGVNATQVVDPVFLVDPKIYHDLADDSTNSMPQNYLLAFILDPSEDKRRGVQAIADKLGLNHIVVYTDANFGRIQLAKSIFTGPQFIFDDEIRPENWLKAYKHADYVVTDSFHGSAFAYIFQKPFSVYFNKTRGSNRFNSLMRLFKLNDTRRIFEEDTAEAITNNQNVTMDIDFSAGNENLRSHVLASHQWLKTALSLPKDQSKCLPGATMLENLKQEESAPVDAEALNSLLSKSFVYYRNGQRSTPMAKGVRLEISGKITGIVNSVHSHRWKFENSKLYFLNNDGQTTTVFDVVKGNDNRMDIKGPFVPNRKVIHILEDEEDWLKDSDKLYAASQKALVQQMGQNDLDRFYNAFGMKWRPRNIGNTKAMMMFFAHALEKGLSHKDFRPGFGKDVLTQLGRETGKWIEGGGSNEDCFYKASVSVARSYFEKHDKLKFDVSSHWNLFTAEVRKDILSADFVSGGVNAVSAPRENLPEESSGRGFAEVAFGRRSVRSFSPRPVSDADILKAVQIATQAPSVCNRQPARVYDITDPDKIKRALEIQIGFRGHAAPPKLLLVTSDLTAFLYAGERNQAYIDGGLFMMMLLLGLEDTGLAACCLNTAMSVAQQDSIRKLLDIPASEVLIAFAAVGHFDEDIVVPISKRLSPEEVIIKR